MTAELTRQIATNHVGGADEFSDECGGRFHVQIARGVDLFDAALVEHGDAVGHRQRFGLIMGDEDESDAELALQLLQFALHLLAQFQIERAERLIEQQHARAIDQARARATRWRWPPDNCTGLRAP
jgi:hypothetical protein